MDDGTSPWIPYTPSRESSIARSGDMQAVIPLTPIHLARNMPPSLEVIPTPPANLNRALSHSLVHLTPAQSLVPHVGGSASSMSQSSLVVTKSTAAHSQREVFMTGPSPSPEVIEVDSDN